MIFAGGIKFILLSAVLFAPGTALYFWARREQNKNVFITSDWIIFIVIGIGAIIGIYALVTGRITI
jgi:arginine:ornithine antiporter/lysine permease